MSSVETVTRQWDARAGEWKQVTVRTAPEPRRVTVRRRGRVGRPLVQAGLSAESPFATSLEYTAYTPGQPFADMRTYLKAPAIKTHRAATTVG